MWWKLTLINVTIGIAIVFLLQNTLETMRASSLHQFQSYIQQEQHSFLLQVDQHSKDDGINNNSRKKRPRRPKLLTSSQEDEEILSRMPLHTWTRTCRANFFSNITWGQFMAPYADKIFAKQLVQFSKDKYIQENNNNHALPVNIVPTHAVLDSMDNFTNILHALVRDLSLQPKTNNQKERGFVIKPAHGSGNIFEVVIPDGPHDGFYAENNLTAPSHHQHSSSSFILPPAFIRCLKSCKGLEPKERRIWKSIYDAQAMEKAHYSLEYELVHGFFDAKRQTQYDYIHKRLLMEQRLPAAKMQSYEWIVVNGHALYVMDAWCDGLATTVANGITQSFYSTQHERFNISTRLTVGQCLEEHPSFNALQFQDMVRIVEYLTRDLPGLVRLDLFTLGNDDEIFFSEFTFTSDMCQKPLEPLIVERIIYYMSNDMIAVPTHDELKQMVNHNDWGLLQQLARIKGQDEILTS